MDLSENITGLQHIGIPTDKFQETLDFYQAIGFKEVHRNRVPETGQEVSFMNNKNLMMEIYESGEPALHTGAIDHIAIDVTDINDAYQYMKDTGFKFAEDQIGSLDFWEKGIRYFIMLGPNSERIEFCQRL